MVRRIVALSEEHQVVVFTHDIWFASELLGEFDHREKECSFYQVTERSGRRGSPPVASTLASTPRPRSAGNDKGIQDARAASEASAGADREDV